MTDPLFGGAQMPAKTDEWLTPPYIWEAVAGDEGFDLDPCSPADRPWNTARRHYTATDNGLILPWDGRVWMNPPYSNLGPWLRRMAAHGRGVALIFSRMDVAAVQDSVLDEATALFFPRGRLRFHLPDGRRGGKAREPGMLCAYGMADADVLAGCGLEGRFVPLRMPRLWAIAAVDVTWGEAIAAWLRAHPGPVHLSEIYRAFAGHPKAKRNPNHQAKIRQILQRGPFQRVGRGVWAAEGA